MIHPALRTSPVNRSAEARLEEAVGLAAAINLDVQHAEVVNLSNPKPGTLFGSGIVEYFQTIIGKVDLGEDEPHPEHPLELVVIDGTLSPVQQRNLERAWNCKVIDRTGLILEIFGERAATREGSLQVELAALTYQRSRLVRSWTHLERQRGGLGFIGGPGESQIELDRRLIDERIARLKKDLGQVRRTRDLHRSKRRKIPHPVVALVGYTNAGKSTLFNTLTRAKVYAQDQLFATLDPTMRGLDLPSGRKVILSDTVGFISDLPHELVAAFHATLEEVHEADVILHVRDISHPDSDAQRDDVLSVMTELGLEEEKRGHVIEVLNKSDNIDAEERDILLNQIERANTAMVLISAIESQGLDRLLHLVNEQLSASHLTESVLVPVQDGAQLSWLYSNAEVLDREDSETDIRLDVRISPANFERYRQRFTNPKH